MVTEFESRRRTLFGLAYRMLGSAADAEHVVQDGFLRWDRTDRTTIDHPDAWLVKVATNLCLNRLTSARATRDRYVGPWLPDPVATDRLGPLETVQQRDSVSFALLVLLERLTPPERAVYVLREAFGYQHREIAAVTELSEANCRQLYRRATRHLTEHRRRGHPSRDHRERLTIRFLAAAESGDLRGLEELLANDIVSWIDSGGHVSAARNPSAGGRRVARYFVGAWRKAPAELRLATADLNAGTAIVAALGDSPIGVITFEFDPGAHRGRPDRRQSDQAVTSGAGRWSLGV